MLADLEAEFQRLATGPEALAVDGRQIGNGLPPRRIGNGLPPRRIGLDELRALLLAPGADTATKDAVWRVLVQRARAEGGDWITGCVGMALPGLRGAAARALRRSPERFADDIVSELLTEFLTQLPRINLAREGIAARLVLWGRKSALRERGRARRYAPLDAYEAAELAELSAHDRTRELRNAPPPSQAEPADLLVEAVRRQVITSGDAALINATRLEGARLRDYAAARGEAASKLYSRRERAEARLTAAIAAGQVSAMSLTHVPNPDPDAVLLH